MKPAGTYHPEATALNIVGTLAAGDHVVRVVRSLQWKSVRAVRLRRGVMLFSNESCSMHDPLPFAVTGCGWVQDPWILDT